MVKILEHIVGVGNGLLLLEQREHYNHKLGGNTSTSWDAEAGVWVCGLKALLEVAGTTVREVGWGRVVESAECLLLTHLSRKESRLNHWGAARELSNNLGII